MLSNIKTSPITVHSRLTKAARNTPNEPERHEIYSSRTARSLRKLRELRDKYGNQEFVLTGDGHYRDMSQCLLSIGT